jgi:hypothetical protein
MWPLRSAIRRIAHVNARRRTPLLDFRISLRRDEFSGEIPDHEYESILILALT